MQYRKLGNSGLDISTVGIGTNNPQVGLDVRTFGSVVLNNTSLWTHAGATFSWNIHGHHGAGGGGALLEPVGRRFTVGRS